MISSIRPAAARRSAALVHVSPPPHGRAREPSCEAHCQAARAAGGRARWSPARRSRSCDQRVAAGQRALGIVGVQRQRQASSRAGPAPARPGARSSSSRAAPSPALACGECGDLGLASQHAQVHGAQVALAGQRRRLAARSSRACWCRRGGGGPRARRGRATGGPGPGRARPPRGDRGAPGRRPAPSELRPRLPAVQRHRRLGGVGGGRAAGRGHVVDQRAVGVVADATRSPAPPAARPCGTASRRRRRTGRPESRRRGPPRSRRPARRRPGPRARAAMRRRGVAVLHRRERPHQAARPAAAAQAGQHVVARLARSRR